MRSMLLCLISSMLFMGCGQSPDAINDQAVSAKAGTNKPQQTTNFQCNSIDAALNKINNKSQINDLVNVNQLLKHCLPQVSNKQQLQWLGASTAMYKRFLNTSDNNENAIKAFEEYGFSILKQASSKTIKQHEVKGNIRLFEKLSPRDQYLIGHQKTAYIELQYVGEGLFEYRRQPQYLLAVFAPALAVEQRVFIRRMAQDNQEIFLNDAAITVSWQELVNRALFWESYIRKYPNSYFIADAKRLYNEYVYFIFLGLDNTPVSDEYAPNTWIDEEALKQIKALAKRQDTAIAKKAQKFLQFIATPIEQRNKQFNIKMLDHDGQTKQQNAITHEQLNQLLELKSPWADENYRDCHTDAVCMS